MDVHIFDMTMTPETVDRLLSDHDFTTPLFAFRREGGEMDLCQIIKANDPNKEFFIYGVCWMKNELTTTNRITGTLTKAYKAIEIGRLALENGWTFGVMQGLDITPIVGYR